MESRFIGNTHIVEFFKKILREESIATTYLFSGPEGVGKKYFAKLIAKSLLCQKKVFLGCNDCNACYKIEKDIHPDLWIYEPENLMITIDQIRTLIQRLKLKPSESNNSIHIIDSVETMRIEAANAFLKITEEPPGFALIVLVTTVPELLPSTVRSRCMKVKFRKIAYRDIYKQLIEMKIPENNARLMAHWAEGSLSKAIAMDYEDHFRLRDLALNMLISMNKNLQSKSFPEALPPVFKRDKALQEKMKKDFKLIAFFLSDLLRECIFIKAGAGEVHNFDIAEEIKKLSQIMDTNTIYDFMKLIEETKEEFNVYHQNPIILLQKLIIA